MNENLQESRMRRLLLLCISAFVTSGALAQAIQRSESDLDFVNRLSSKTGYLASRVDDLFAITGYQRSGRSAANSGDTGFSVYSPNSAHDAPQTRSRGVLRVSETDLNRANRKLVSISRTLEKHRESLESGEELTEKQLATRDKKLQQIDRDLENIERDIVVMEKQVR